MTTGLMFGADHLPGATVTALARDVEQCGFDSLWVPEVFGREPFVTAGALLAATKSVQVGTGIANVYARDPLALQAAAHTLQEMYGGRFVLGLSVSNPQANARRGHDWVPPVQKLEEVFDAMDDAPLMFRQDTPIDRLVAGHGPKILDFVARRADGAFLYLQPLASTEKARERIGSEKSLSILQPCFIGSDPEEARRKARRALSVYLPLPNYHRAWRQAGYSESDWSDGGSDRLVDDLVIWGAPDTVRSKLAAQRDAGADRLVLIALNTDAEKRPDVALLREIL